MYLRRASSISLLEGEDSCCEGVLLLASVAREESPLQTKSQLRCMEDLGTGPAVPRQIFVGYRKQPKGRLSLKSTGLSSWTENCTSCFRGGIREIGGVSREAAFFGLIEAGRTINLDLNDWSLDRLSSL
jgi:hypothetical protein